MKATLRQSYEVGDLALRLLTTLQASLTITLGDTTHARQAARDVGRRHATVTGAITDPAGGLAADTAYSAADPRLA